MIKALQNIPVCGLVKRDLKFLVKALRPFYPKMACLAFQGSVATGELTFVHINRSSELLSDYDVVVIMKASDERLRMAIISVVKAVESEVKRRYSNRLFHIGLKVRSLSDYAVLTETRVRIIELRLRSATVYGDDILSLIPLQPVPVCECLESALTQLWYALLYLPNALPSDEDRLLLRLEIRYRLVKNILYLATFLSFAEGVFFPEYRLRAEWAATHYRGLVDTFASDVLLCADIKQQGALAKVSEKTLLQKTIAAYDAYFRKYAFLTQGVSQEAVFAAKYLLGTYSLLNSEPTGLQASATYGLLQAVSALTADDTPFSRRRVEEALQAGSSARAVQLLKEGYYHFLMRRSASERKDQTVSYASLLGGLSHASE